MEVAGNPPARELQTLYRTVVDVDMVGYSTTARMLEQNMGSVAVADLNRQIQQLVESALRHLPSPKTYSRIKETGDGILLLFEAPQEAHLFAEQLQLNAQKHNRGRTDPTALRRFRIGIATGEVTQEPRSGEEMRYAGIAISDAVRLEGSAAPGEIVIDLTTYSLLPEPDRRSYGPESTIQGKREEVFVVRKFQVTGPYPSPESAPASLPKESSLPKQPSLPKHRILEISAAVVSAGIAVAAFWLSHRRHTPPAPSADPPVLQRVQAKPSVLSKGDTLTITVELDRPAPKGDTTVNLVSSDPAILTMDHNAVVAEGERTATVYTKVDQVPTYRSPIRISANYNDQTRLADVNVEPLKTPPFAIAINNPPNAPRTNRGSHEVHTPPLTGSHPPKDSQLPSTTPPTPPALDPELLTLLEEAQAGLSAEKSYWENVKNHMYAGSSLRPEITSQIFAAESTSQRCTKDRQALNAPALASCILSLNDHLTQLRIQH